MAKVYVVQEQRKLDLSPAERFGELETLVGPGGGFMSTGPLVRRLRTLLKNFSDDDFILLTGDPVAIGAAVAVAADINMGRVKLLKWSSSAKDYVELPIDVRHRCVGPEENAV